jgi:hypothetical protein
VDQADPAVLHVAAGLLSLDEQSLDEHLNRARQDRNRSATVKTAALGVDRLACIPRADGHGW